MSRPLLGLTLLSSLFLPLAVLAQSAPAFTLSISPSYPAPYSSATVSVTSASFDFSSATLAATVNGVSVYSGNVAPFPVNIGAPGKTITVKATITQGPLTYTQSLSFTPQGVSLVTEPEATVPPLYSGRPLIPLSGTVHMVAVAEFKTSAGTPVDPKTLSYTWSADNTTLQNQSGIGKMSAEIPVPLQYRSRTVSVVVKTTSGSSIGAANAALSGSDPSVRIYQNDPLLGIRFDHALLSSYTLTGSEVSLFGAPYSFSTAGGAPALSWILNGSVAQTGSSLTLRPTGTGQGNATLSLSVSKQSTLENALTTLAIIFGTKSSGGLFGL